MPFNIVIPWLRNLKLARASRSLQELTEEPTTELVEGDFGCEAIRKAKLTPVASLPGKSQP
jgi:hypothetical protein